MKRFILVGAALALLLGGVGHAKANTIVFDASGTFADGATLGGTMTIDVTAGVATAVDLVVGPPDSLTFSFLQGQNVSGSATIIETGLAATGFPVLSILVPTTTLVGYSGGLLASDSHVVNGNETSGIIHSISGGFVDLAQGGLTPVPEPASLTLMSVGAVGLVGYTWRRRKRTAE